MKNKKNFKSQLFFGVAYSGIFAIICVGIFLPFLVQNKSFLWNADGLFQTYSSMVYISEYYRNIFNGLLHGNFNPQMIDFKIGLGYDVFTTLNYYGLGDPLLIFSVFFNKQNMYLFYNSLLIIRLYLVGIGFLLYCTKMSKKKYQSLIGAIIYVFCGFAIVAGERHPYFINGMIYLPFLLIGVENILKKKKSYLFTIMVFVSVVSNYYFFYMLTIMVFLYAFIRFLDIYRVDWKKNVLNVLFRGIIQYLVGIMLAAFALAPTIYAFLNNARGTSAAYNDGIWYEIKYYKKIIYAFFSTPLDVDGNFTYLAYAPICMFIVIFLFLYKENFKKYIALKCGYILATLMLITPVAAYIMNGMSYPSNRWIFGYSFLSAFMVVCLLEDLIKVSAKRLLPMAVISVLLVVFYFLMDTVSGRFPITGIFYLIVMIVVLLGITRIKNINIKYGSILVITMMAVITFGFYQNSSIGINYVEEFRENGQANNIIENCPQSSINYEADNTFYRIGSYGNKVENQSLTLGYNGTASYYSLVDGNILKYIMDMEMTAIRQPHRFYGLDERTYLDALAGVKYYAFEADSLQEKGRPYGYEQISRVTRINSNITDVVYENKYALPLGYTYDQKIDIEYYDNLSSIQKQQAMLQAVVVENADKNSQDNMKYSEEQLEYTLDSTNGIMWDENLGILNVDNANNTLTINFQAKKDCETYVRLLGLDIEKSQTVHFTANATSGNAESKLYLTNSQYRWDLERENYLINLGHNNDGNTTCTITFSQPGEFELKDIEVYSLPMTDYIDQVTELKEEALNDIQLSNNKITGNIDLSKDKTLCFSVLYNSGWTLKVDGKETPLYKANTMYMAADITKGIHAIELTYQTPGMKAGLMISLMTVVALIVIAVFLYFNKKSALIQKN